jgi:predicted transcriptional regulator
MAKNSYITDFERDLIRIGFGSGLNASAIARYIGRNRMAVHNQMRNMSNSGTITLIPTGLSAENIAKDMQRVGQ